MNLTNKIILSLLFLFLSSFCLEAQSRPLNDYIVEFNHQINKNNGFSFTGFYQTGEKEIETISLYYSSNEPQELDEARKTFVQFVDSFLNGLNESPRLKPQLKKFPFSEKNLDVVLFFRNDQGQYAKPPFIAQISLKEGIVLYSKYEKGHFIIVKQENFLKAEKESF